VTVVCAHIWPAANVFWQQFLQDLKEPVFLFQNTLPLQKRKPGTDASRSCILLWVPAISEIRHLLIWPQRRLYQDFTSLGPGTWAVRQRGSCCRFGRVLQL